MSLEVSKDLTSIQVVFEECAGYYGVGVINFICKDDHDDLAMQKRWLLNQRGITFRDFQDAVMFQLGASGITGAHVTFISRDRYIQQESKEQQSHHDVKTTEAMVFDGLAAA